MADRKRILCVEDSRYTRKLIAAILKDFDLTLVSTKADALRLVSSEKFDLISLDHDLSDGTGVEICLFVRSFDQKTPIIFATASDSITMSDIQTAGGQGLVRKGPNFQRDLRVAIEGISSYRQH